MFSFLCGVHVVRFVVFLFVCPVVLHLVTVRFFCFCCFLVRLCLVFRLLRSLFLFCCVLRCVGMCGCFLLFFSWLPSVVFVFSCLWSFVSFVLVVFCLLLHLYALCRLCCLCPFFWLFCCFFRPLAPLGFLALPSCPFPALACHLSLV